MSPSATLQCDIGMRRSVRPSVRLSQLVLTKKLMTVPSRNIHRRLPQGLLVFFLI